MAVIAMSTSLLSAKLTWTCNQGIFLLGVISVSFCSSAAAANCSLRIETANDGVRDSSYDDNDNVSDSSYI